MEPLTSRRSKTLTIYM